MGPDSLRADLTARYSLRLHMCGILLLTLLSAALGDFLLLYFFELKAMHLRYPLSAFLAYVGFFAWIRLWLWLVLPARRGSTFNGGDLLDSTNWTPGGSGGRAEPWGGGGGGFGGGGATSSFDGNADSNMLMVASSPSRDGSSSGSSFFDLGGGDDDSGLVLVIIAGTVLVAAIVGAGAYVIYQSPDILSDAATQLAISTGLLFPSRRRLATWWQEGVVRKTAIPFLCISILCFAFGLAAENYCPGAVRLAQVLRHACLKR